jgi:signal transduction histidine kinase
VDLLGDDAFAYMGTEVNDAHGPRDVLRRGLVLSERETEIRRSDDTRLPVALHGTPIREDDRLLGAVIVFRDTTEERELHRQLLHAQKLESIGQLAAGIAHEINTPTQYVGDNVRFLRESFSQLLDPLRGIQSAIESDEALQSVPALAAIRRSLAESDVDYLREEVPRSLEQCVDGIDRISTIVRAMKQFSHPGQERSLADINRAIESTVTVASNEWKYVAEVVLDLDPSLPRLECMIGELNQVVLNLVVNAAQAIAERSAETEGTRGTIRITTRAVDGSIEIAISDDGTGLSEELLERVFDPFFTTKPVGSGTGQGLAIAHSVVCRKHGGKLNVASEVGKGSTFTILLPREPATEPAAS